MNGDFSGVIPEENPLSYEVWFLGQDEEVQAMITNHNLSLVSGTIELKTELEVIKAGLRDIVERKEEELHMLKQILGIKSGENPSKPA